jgi:hypothetical protein
MRTTTKRKKLSSLLEPNDIEAKNQILESNDGANANVPPL